MFGRKTRAARQKSMSEALARLEAHIAEMRRLSEVRFELKGGDLVAVLDKHKRDHGL